VPYTASRHAMVGMSYSLREELEQYGIGVSVICPSQVNTGYFERNDADIRWYPRLSQWFPVLEPDVVGKRAVQAIRENRGELIFPWQLALLTNVYRRMPVTGLRLFKWLRLFQPRLNPHETPTKQEAIDA